MKIISTGQSLSDLKKEYGMGENGFYRQSWYKDESFFTDKPEKGEYEVLIEEKALTNLTYKGQVKKIKKGWEFPHPAILAQALLEYHKATGKYTMEDWYSRTSLLASVGSRVGVGCFDSDGLYVRCYWDGSAYDDIGFASSRKSNKNLDTGSLESFDSSDFERRLKKLEEWKAKVQQD